MRVRKGLPTPLGRINMLYLVNWLHRAALTPLLVLCIAVPALAAQDAPPAPPPNGWDLHIDSFAATRAYVIGGDPVTLVATVRNAGSAALPANTVRGRLYCLAGLDYSAGDTTPWIPPLDPNGSITFRWQVQPRSSDSALVAAFALETEGKEPQVIVLPIQHFAQTPNVSGSAIPKRPVAFVNRDGGVIENDRVRLVVCVTGANVPALFLSGRIGAGWKQASVLLPAAQVLSGEAAQEPWWEVFRGSDLIAVNGKGGAALRITGGFGLRWRATLELALQPGATEIEMRLRLSPLRPLKISGLRFGPLYLGDGSFGAQVDEVTAPRSINGKTINAVRWQNLTAGAAWPEKPLFDGWKSSALPPVDGVDYRLLGWEMRSDGPPVLLTPGALIEARAWLRAQGPTPPPPKPVVKPKPKPEPRRHGRRRR